MTGKGSVNHNSRKFHAKNTDPERSCLNVEYCNENIKDVYHELFDEALARYNEKQTRSDRRIDDYYGKICSGKQEKPFHEIILQIGDKDNMGAKTENGQLAVKVLDKYMQDFQQRNPTLRVFSAYLHMDVASPLLLFVFLNWQFVFSVISPNVIIRKVSGWQKNKTSYSVSSKWMNRTVFGSATSLALRSMASISISA